MTTEPSISDMQRRIRRWLHERAETDGDGTLQGLDQDLAALESELQTLYAAEEATRGRFEALRDQSSFGTVLESAMSCLSATPRLRPKFAFG